ncbi:hypothetical protein BJV74DRAFT_793126 [Russula compacta]|nr:hypothetical protein BJV74DRAFT_793126 [Russula compacta]
MTWKADGLQTQLGFCVMVRVVYNGLSYASALWHSSWKYAGRLLVAPVGTPFRRILDHLTFGLMWEWKSSSSGHLGELAQGDIEASCEDQVPLCHPPHSRQVKHSTLGVGQMVIDLGAKFMFWDSVFFFDRVFAKVQNQARPGLGSNFSTVCIVELHVWGWGGNGGGGVLGGKSQDNCEDRVGIER